MRNAEFHHPRLVEVYDAACPWSREDDFFRAIVDETLGVRVLDLGCGTGRLTVGLSKAGRTVTGVDPAAASLHAAHEKPGAKAVTWMHGTSTLLAENAFDVAVMTSHVAQFFVSDDEWARTLNDLARSLVADGTLAFDTRDPRARAWERWNPTDSRRRVLLPGGRSVAVWTEVTEVDGSVVTFTHHYRFHGGKELRSESTLRFRTEAQIRESLHDAGLTVDRIYGGWDRQPVGHGDGELIVIARS